jgi:hypothetical protein
MSDERNVVRVQLGMHLIVDVPSYQRAGQLMDAIDEAMRASQARVAVDGRFDFTSVQTHRIEGEPSP